MAGLDNSPSLIWDSGAARCSITRRDIELRAPFAHGPRMNLRILFLTGLLVALPALAEAACYADYKAKRDDPLRLHYGVVKVGDGACPDAGRVADEIARRISRDGWQLLNVVSLFDDAGLDQRRQSAGEFFLRY